MSGAAKMLTGLAGLAFVLAIVANFTGPIINTAAEGYSRACSNLALMAIALTLAFGNRGDHPGRPGTSL